MPASAKALRTITRMGSPLSAERIFRLFFVTVGTVI